MDHEHSRSVDEPQGGPPKVAPADVDAGSLRAALGAFATGVTVVTASSGDEPVLGMTVSSFNSVSLEPPLVLWSVRKASASLADWLRLPGFVINVLSDRQQDLVTRFSRPRTDRFDGIDWRPGRYGPILDGVIAHFDCSRHAEHDAGDHLILIGRVHACDAAEGRPLVHWRGRDGKRTH